LIDLVRQYSNPWFYKEVLFYVWYCAVMWFIEIVVPFFRIVVCTGGQISISK
jgi:hypothetical protein